MLPTAGAEVLRCFRSGGARGSVINVARASVPCMARTGLDDATPEPLSVILERKSVAGIGNGVLPPL